MSEINDNRQLTLGDVVLIKVKSPMGGGERAYVYETYADFDHKDKVGVQLITETGVDTGGWSWDEQKMFLEYIGRANWDYQFQNVGRLAEDFRAGVFDQAFKTQLK